ncbi:tRNA(Arg) A34 adenosine deaminase TadA [Pseudomonas sp. TE3786]
MQRTLIFTALFATSSLFFSQLSLAEESPAFVARNAAIAQQQQSAHAEAVATQKAAEKAAQDS